MKRRVTNGRGKPLDGLFADVRELERAKEKARALGLFTDDRDLLECPMCRLLEDVTCDGLLITYRNDSPDMTDTGLRFLELNENAFQCPACGAKCRLPTEQKLVEDVDREKRRR